MYEGPRSSATPSHFSVFDSDCTIVARNPPHLTRPCKEWPPMNWRLGLTGWSVLMLAACGGGDKSSGGSTAAAKKITISPTSDARADAKAYLAQLCQKPIGGELN